MLFWKHLKYLRNKVILVGNDMRLNWIFFTIWFLQKTEQSWIKAKTLNVLLIKHFYNVRYSNTKPLSVMYIFKGVNLQ